MEKTKYTCIIVHGCPSNKERAMNPETSTFNKGWLPWLRDQLHSKGINTTFPMMPTPWYAQYAEYKELFDKLNVDENTILVGTSCGSAFLLRWLGETKKKVHSLFLVAPWAIAMKEENKPFYDFTVDPTIAQRVKNIVYFTSDNEYDTGKKSLEMFHSVLDGKIVSLPNHGHYTVRSMGKNDLPELLDEILSIL